ncbi:alpha-amylase family glycosyl hydrolase [Culicoidibacter larvae]|uniref:Alpha-amylase n=1 Tax=Culicoidibacter larvae TaxID=2579976 RepID=A0A5R8QF48_9FIRM|nr:alpha-amylase family glycosyl hydrolase [Culicoidibacter larvae]TLG76661.1 alpha-amylase [Culicoidibacter larvae]
MKGFDYRVSQQLRKIYGDEYKDEYAESMLALIHEWEQVTWHEIKPMNQKNVFLSTYSDSFVEDGKKPLETLKEFLDNYGKDMFTDVHILSMFGPNRDNDFTVSDHFNLDPSLGTWENIEELAAEYRLMFNFVANHVSDDSIWFQEYLNGISDYRDFFIEKGMIADVSNTFRPTSGPLFVEYESVNGPVEVWSTWGEGTVDLNVHNYQVLEILTQALISYIYHGASSIRIDSIGSLWKESGARNAYMPQTHQILTLWRIILDYLQVNVQVLPLTNGSPRENWNYFGDGHNEASLVYQWALAPLVLYTLVAGDTEAIESWAKKIQPASNEATYFNFIINNELLDMRAVDDIMTEGQKQKLVEKIEASGGEAVYAKRPDGEGEMLRAFRTAFFTALVDEDESRQKKFDKFIAAHFIMLSMIGVPAIFYHTLVGSKVATGAHNKVNYQELKRELEDKELGAVYSRLKNLIEARGEHSAFNPYTQQRILDPENVHIFGLERYCSETGERIYCYVNVTNHRQKMQLPPGIDLVDNKAIKAQEYRFEPYECMWLVVNQAQIK